ncbi:hypothetical protein [Streptomyces sp. NPDC051211]|uniref:hypothetical protein n=1 Tax=Streptomyces sp. NPDC051211 TaxID=3154643 RepID=UPI0034506370
MDLHTLPKVTASVLLELIDSPATDAVVYFDPEGGTLKIGATANVGGDWVVESRSDLLEGLLLSDNDARVTAAGLDDEDRLALAHHLETFADSWEETIAGMVDTDEELDA